MQRKVIIKAKKEGMVDDCDDAAFKKMGGMFKVKSPSVYKSQRLYANKLNSLRYSPFFF